MRRIWRIILGVVLVAVLAGTMAACQRQTAAETAPTLNVVTSFYPMYDFAVKVGGNRIAVSNLVPAGTEPHDWEPSPADIAKLEEADVFIYNGAGMEHWVDDVLSSLGNKDLIVVEASSGAQLLDGHGEEGEADAQYDPHVWLAPQDAKLEMKNIRDSFIKADPDGTDVYNANFDRWAGELDALDQQFAKALTPLTKKDIVVAHQAFGYLCAAYGLNQVAIEGLSPDSEPTPERMAQVIEFCKANDVKVIFFEELVSPDVAQTIADATGARTDVLNPIEGLTDERLASGADYISVMKENLAALSSALQ